MHNSNNVRKTSRVMFLDLPVELRLRIAEYALEQRPAAAIPVAVRGPYEDMALLFVCRQLNTDFTQLAYNKIRFLISHSSHIVGLQQLSLPRLRSIKRLAYISNVPAMEFWGSHFLNLEQLHLDELVFLWSTHSPSDARVLAFMRRLKHVKVAKFVLYANYKSNHSEYCALIGAMMKEDHFQRYDAASGPNVEATWWDWRLNAQGNVITFEAQEPRPILPEEEYMVLMKPKVDALMAEAERAAGIQPTA